MKKRFLLIPMLALLVACGRDGNDNESVVQITPNTGVVNTGIKPPSWIIGSWRDASISTVGFRFTADDMLQVVGGNELSYKGFLVNGWTVRGQHSSDTEYKIVYVKPGGLGTETFTFRKVSATEILFVEENETYIKR